MTDIELSEKLKEASDDDDRIRIIKQYRRYQASLIKEEIRKLDIMGLVEQAIEKVAQ